MIIKRRTLKDIAKSFHICDATYQGFSDVLLVVESISKVVKSFCVLHGITVIYDLYVPNSSYSNQRIIYFYPSKYNQGHYTSHGRNITTVTSYSTLHKHTTLII